MFNAGENIDAQPLSLDEANRVLRAMGYRLTVEKIGETAVAKSSAVYEVEAGDN